MIEQLHVLVNSLVVGWHSIRVKLYKVLLVFLQNSLLFLSEVVARAHVVVHVPES